MTRINHIKLGLLSAAACMAASCTGDFDSFNTNPDAVQQIDVKNYITTMERDAVIPTSDEGANEYQRACNLMGDTFGGYFAPIQAFNGGSYTCTYDLDGTDYNNVPFSVAFTNVMPAWLQLKYAHENGQITDDIFAVAEVIRVMALQRATDIYGPIPVSHFGETENPYESQQTVYENLFRDLDAAIATLTEYATNSADAHPLEKVDAIYQGDYPKWLKLANSVKLRMAMRIRFVEPGKAQEYAEAAVAAGVMESSDDGAWLKTSGSIVIFNPLEEVWNAYEDTRMGATIDAYMNGYDDPRLPIYFKGSELDSKYHGVRSGLKSMLKEHYTRLSVPNVAKTTPVVWMLASEVAFLRAEGAMLNWDMGGKDEDFYKKGIELSFLENGLSAGDAAAYAESDAQPGKFEDSSESTNKYNYAQPSTITPKWNASAGDEEKLERIITQKWLAMYPNGQEAWSEFRRTGYPKLIPIVDNMSGGKVATDEQMRRMTFPRSEYSNNLTGVQQAISLLGGPDTGGTHLWWDKKNR